MDSIFYKCAICYKSLYIIFAISSCDHLVEVAQLGARHYLQRFRVVVLDYLVAEVVFSLLPAGLAELAGLCETLRLRRWLHRECCSYEFRRLGGPGDGFPLARGGRHQHLVRQLAAWVA